MKQLLIVDERQALAPRLRAILDARFQATVVAQIHEIGDDQFALAVVAPHTSSPNFTCALLLERALAQRVLLLTATRTLGETILAIRAGASDLVAVSSGVSTIVARVEATLNEAQLRGTLASLAGGTRPSRQFPDFVGESPSCRLLRDWLRSEVASDLPAVVIGEGGTGKDLFAAVLHGSGPRRHRPFVRVSCDRAEQTVPTWQHLSAQLNQAADGTIYLDRFTELPIDLQHGLAEAIGATQAEPLGSARFRRCSARVLASSTEDLAAALNAGRLARELYVALRERCVHLPPLRERGGDALLLAYQFIRDARCSAKPIRGITPGAARMLLKHNWPGNIRELRQRVISALAVAQHDQITSADLQVTGATGVPVPHQPRDVVSWYSIERQHILKVLQSTRGNKSLAARYLGLDRKTLQRKLREYEG